MNGDRIVDEAFYRGRLQQNGMWAINRSAVAGHTLENWGIHGDLPVVGDIDGDNKADFNIYRPSDGTWWSIRSFIRLNRIFLGNSWGTILPLLTMTATTGTILPSGALKTEPGGFFNPLEVPAEP